MSSSALIRSTPGDEGKWFATAKTLKLYELAAQLAHHSPCEPKTLNRAARDHLATMPEFALVVALASLKWLAQGWGYEVTGYDVLEAHDHVTNAARALGREEEARKRVLAVVSGDHSPAMWVRQILGRRLGLK